MELKLVRHEFTSESTIGELLINDKHECFVLEDVVREDGVKVAGDTAIPYGRYEVVVTYSPKFGRYLPLLLNVPNFTGIRIHKGNTNKDTEGCLIVGTSKGKDVVLESAKAFDKLYPKIVYSLQNEGKLHIEVTTL